MFTFALFVVALLLALGVFLQRRAFHSRHFANANSALEAQLDQMIASLDAAERDDLREQRQIRRLERESAIARGEIAPSSPRQKKPDSSETPGKQHSLSVDLVAQSQASADLPPTESVPSLEKPSLQKRRERKKPRSQVKESSPVATPSTANLPPQPEALVTPRAVASTHAIQAEPILTTSEPQRLARTAIFWHAIARIVIPILRLPRLFLSLFNKRA